MEFDLNKIVHGEPPFETDIDKDERIRELEAQLAEARRDIEQYQTTLQEEYDKREALDDKLAELKKGEPVAWMSPEGRMFTTNVDARFNGTNTSGFVPLYLAPVIPEKVKGE